jgi:uncharacterized protein YlxP (DUF503 family)
MKVLVSRIELHIPYSSSLKDKRRVVRALKDKIWSKFRASISEVDGHDSRQVAILGLSYVSNDSALLDSVMNKIVVFIEDAYPGLLHSYDHHVEHY